MTTYEPFKTASDTEQNQEYVPFQESGAKSNEEYTPFGNNSQTIERVKKNKCEYCGKPNANANCHAHEKWCTYYCGGGDTHNIPIGNGFTPLMIFVGIYLVLKKIKWL